MKTLITLLAVLMSTVFGVHSAPAPTEWLAYGSVVEVTETGLLVECRDTDTIGHKKTSGTIHIVGYPNWKQQLAHAPIKCFVTYDGNIYAPKTVAEYRFLRVRPGSPF